MARAMRQSKDEGGHTPVVTGNLQKSLAASTYGLPPILFKSRKSKSAAEVEFSGDLQSIDAVIDSATLEQTVWLGFQAPYAAKIETKEGFVRLPEQRWQQIVDEATATVKARLGL